MCIPSGCLYISKNLVRWGGKTDKGNVTRLMFQWVKTYCAAFCASCALRWWKERQTASKLGEDLAQFIQYSYLDKGEFYFWRFNVKKTTLPLPVKTLSCLNIQWCVYMDAKFQGFVEKCVFAPRFLVYRGKKKRSRNLLKLNFIPTSKICQLSNSDGMLLLTGKIVKE